MGKHSSLLMTCDNCTTQQHHSEQYTNKKWSESVCVCVFAPFLPAFSLNVSFRANIFISFSHEFLLPCSAAFWPSVAFVRTSLPLKPGTLRPRSARAWRSCSTGTRLLSIQRCPWQEGALLAGRPVVTICFFTLSPSHFALFFRMRNVQAQQLLHWPPGLKPTSSTPTFWRESSPWRESRPDCKSRKSKLKHFRQVSISSSSHFPVCIYNMGRSSLVEVFSF